MGKSVFNKNLRKSCSICVHGIKSEFSSLVFCKKKGVVLEDEPCRKYEYNPLKRCPEKSEISSNYSPEDFKL